MAGRDQTGNGIGQLQLPLDARLVTIEEVACLIGVPKSFVYRRTARGHADPIPHYRLGGHLRFKLKDVEAWIENHRADQPVRTALVAATRRRGTASTRERLVRRNPT